MLAGAINVSAGQITSSPFLNLGSVKISAMLVQEEVTKANFLL